MGHSPFPPPHCCCYPVNPAAKTLFMSRLLTQELITLTCLMILLFLDNAGSRVRKSWIRGYQNVCRGGGCDPGSSNWGGGVIEPHCIPVIDLSNLFRNQIPWKRANSKWNRQISFFSLHVLQHSFGRPFNENGWHQNEKQSSLVYQGPF